MYFSGYSIQRVVHQKSHYPLSTRLSRYKQEGQCRLNAPLAVLPLLYCERVASTRCLIESGPGSSRLCVIGPWRRRSLTLIAGFDVIALRTHRREAALLGKFSDQRAGTTSDRNQRNFQLVSDIPEGSPKRTLPSPHASREMRLSGERAMARRRRRARLLRCTECGVRDADFVISGCSDLRRTVPQQCCLPGLFVKQAPPVCFEIPLPLLLGGGLVGTSKKETKEPLPYAHPALPKISLVRF